MKKRSVGIVIWSSLLMLWGTYGIGAAAFSVSTLQGDALLCAWMSFPFSIGSGVIWLVCGVGVLRLKNWTRLLALLNAGIGLLFPLTLVIANLNPPPALDVTSALSLSGILIANGLILWYFLRTSVKAQFSSANAFFRQRE